MMKLLKQEAIYITVKILNSQLPTVQEHILGTSKLMTQNKATLCGTSWFYNTNLSIFLKIQF